MAIRRIGQIFVDLGFIDEDQLEMLLEEQRENRPSELLGKIGVSLDLLAEEQVAQALAEQFGMQVFSVGDAVIPPEVQQKITSEMANMYRIIPIAFRDNVLTVAMCDPQKLYILDELRNFLGYEVRAVVSTDADVTQALKRYYNQEESIEDIFKDLNEDQDLRKSIENVFGSGPLDLSNVEDWVNSEPVRKLLNTVLLLAIRDKASDLHFEPFEDEFKIRIKADGVLYEMVPPPRHLAFAITTRIKVLANLDIAERRMPQDGRIMLTLDGHPVDLRVATCPTMFGESVVLRILDRTVVKLDLAQVGLDTATLKVFREIIRKPNGIVLVTGPTGSGKTTTLYSALNELNVIEDKIITTEDPVEYDMDGIVQVPVDSELGVTFAACLRAILRQDPDKILVGEIRDLETAEIAVQASLTGHMVFSTLHTNDSPGTITRLRDMGIPPFLITATVEAILAQRLVRRICTSCREETTVSPEVLLDMQLTPDKIVGKKFYRGRGCEACNNSGYRGRRGLFELMIMNDELRDMIMRSASTDELRTAAQGYGMVTLRDAGLQAIFAGDTTVDEVLRETIVDG
jgi:type IV pilus assembly protein PilB